jgi:CBS-domain-containing membrane protein
MWSNCGRLFSEERHHHIPIIDATGRQVGIIT